jgi:hypothetical protein
MNAVDVDFVVTAEDFESYEKRLAERGIKVRPMARETVEDLEKGGLSHLSISGILVFDGAEYIYHISKFPKTCRLTLDAFSHDKRRGEALLAEIRRVFPQPERVTAVQLGTPDPYRNRTIPNIIGCLIVLAFIGAVCFFAIVGIRSFFWK